MNAAVPAILLFAHLSLHDAQADALVASPDVAIARGRVAEAQALCDQARATYGPALTANYTQSPQAGPNNNSTVIQRLTTVGASWTLGDLFAYAPAVAQANASLRAAQLNLTDAQRNEEVSVITAYYAALGAQATLSARNEELSAANAELRAAELRYTSGDAPRLDVVRASVALATAQADRARAQADAGDADAALATETGLAVDVLQATIPARQTALPINLSASAAAVQALTRRPDVASAREAVSAEEHAVGVARRAGWPLITLSGGYTQGTDTGIAVSGASATVDVSVPVTGAAHDRVAAEEARLDEARAALAKIERSVALEVGSAIRAYDAQTAALAASQRALQQAQSELAATQIGYRNGAVSSLDVESARATYVQALVNEIASLYAQARARAVLDLLLGSINA